MKIAIASSGLGHISRGIETWARDTASALHEQGIDVTLFAAGECEGVGVTEYRGYGVTQHRETILPRDGGLHHPGTPSPRHPDTPSPLTILPCWRRYDRKTQLLAKLMPGFCWRWGWKRAYDIEQHTFWRHLKKALIKGDFDILHVQDPLIADLCRKARLSGQIKTREILAHGTEEPPEFLANFEYLQHLAPWHLENTEKILTEARRTQREGENAECRTENLVPQSETKNPELPSHPTFHNPNRKHWFVSPNFVDTKTFFHSPGMKAEFRVKTGIPEDALVIGCAAAIKRSHKRLDYLIDEFIEYLRKTKDQKRNPYLVLAGAWEKPSHEIESLVRVSGCPQIKILYNLPMAQMPAFYNAIDLFVLPSLFEMLGIVFLESMACETPCLGHKHPVLEWVVGPGGANIDMAAEGELAHFLSQITPEWLEEKGKLARRHALENFSKDAVIQQYIDYYREVLSP